MKMCNIKKNMLLNNYIEISVCLKSARITDIWKTSKFSDNKYLRYLVFPNHCDFITENCTPSCSDYN